MGWSLGYDNSWNRDIGYGVPATCDYPTCKAKIDRGLSYVCGGQPYGGEYGCGLYFCGKHLGYQPFNPAGERVDEDTLEGDDELDYAPLCERCMAEKEPFDPKPDTKQWARHKLKHPSWAEWRAENQEAVSDLLKLYPDIKVKVNSKAQSSAQGKE